MSASKNKNGDTIKYEDIDEAEEEALLKSDDEGDASRAKANPEVILPPATSQDDDDSLMNETAPHLGTERDAVVGGSAGLAVVVIDDDDDNNDVHDDDDDDDDDDEGDDLDESDIKLLEYGKALAELQNNQYAYDKFLRLCELSHGTEDLESIRKAYKLFASAYPLTPDLWLKLIRVELNVSQSPTEIAHVDNLFRKALGDYFSVDVAQEYATFAARTPEPERIWNEVLGTYALHCLRGQELFKHYRQYIGNNSGMSAEEKQDAYINSYLRELKYPLHNMEESYIEFKVFYEKNKTNISQDIDWESIDRAYFKAKEHLKSISPFEQELSALDAKNYRERADVYMRYITEMDKFLDENVLQTVYERMVFDCCLIALCWQKYMDFVEYRDEFWRPIELQDLPVFQQDALDINQRALRNCTWSEELYIKRMRLLEKRGKTREEIQEVLESSLNAGFETAEPAVSIWLEYLTYLRRSTDWANEDECDILRKNFNLAWTILGKQWGVLADCDCEILKFWGRLEYGPLQDVNRGKELWTTVMESSDNGTKSGLWIEFTQLETRRDLDATRKLFRKALNSPGLDNPGVITSAWERFERCNGSVKTLSNCTKECGLFFGQYRKLRQRLHSATEVAKTSSKSLSKGTKRSAAETKEVWPEKRSKLQGSATGKSERQHGSGATDQRKQREPAFKEHENQDFDLAKDHLRIFLSNLDYNLNENDVREGLSNLKIMSVNLIRSGNGRSRGFGYVELESAAEVEKALAMDRCTLNGRPVFISSVLRDKEQRQKFKYSDGVEPQKLFIKGLPDNAKKEELETLFSKCGKLKDVRLVYHKSGKFKGIAYVEYEEAAAAGKAVMMLDQMVLGAQTISVAISAPPPKQTAPPVNPSKLLGSSMRRTKVFDQKPRMSLIPNVVRQLLSTKVAGDIHAESATTVTNNGNAAPPASKKTNADFRQLLLQKSP